MSIEQGLAIKKKKWPLTRLCVLGALIFGLLSLHSAAEELADVKESVEEKAEGRAEDDAVKNTVENADELALPEPLTLKHALSLYDESSNPNVRLAQAGFASANAEKLLLDAKNGFQVDAYASLIAVKPSSILPDDYSDRNNDHEVGINISKRLYDFGRSAARLSASDNYMQAAQFYYQEKTGDNYLDILRNYFNVILADLRFNRDNEALAMAFIRFDRARIKSEMKKVSELDVLNLQNKFQQANKIRFKSETLQRLERAKLANSLNRPGQLPGELETPDLSSIPSLAMQRELPPLETLEQLILQGNKQLQGLQSKLNAENFQLKAHQAERYPILTGELESTWHSRELGGSDKARAGVSVHIPIYQGGEINASQALTRAKIMSLTASVDILKMQLKQQVLEIWLEIDSLKQQFKQVQSALDYREMYLDKSRTEYESELKSDLGDAMVHLSGAQLLDMETRFSVAYQWARLGVLSGDGQLYGMEKNINE